MPCQPGPQTPSLSTWWVVEGGRGRAALLTTSKQPRQASRSSHLIPLYCQHPPHKVSCALPLRAPFLQIGDWGRRGVREQRKVSNMMATIAACMPPAFIISTGDNFYSRE